MGRWVGTGSGKPWRGGQGHLCRPQRWLGFGEERELAPQGRGASARGPCEGPRRARSLSRGGTRATQAPGQSPAHQVSGLPRPLKLLRRGQRAHHMVPVCQRGESVSDANTGHQDGQGRCRRGDWLNGVCRRPFPGPVGPAPVTLRCLFQSLSFSRPCLPPRMAPGHPVLWGP